MYHWFGILRRADSLRWPWQNMAVAELFDSTEIAVQGFSIYNYYLPL